MDEKENLQDLLNWITEDPKTMTLVNQHQRWFKRTEKLKEGEPYETRKD